jgi:Restriction endonuclease BpuJI - N terminal/Domain of unknown function (DUF3883)
MFNPDIQYRCDIIRGKAQKELDNLLPAYANIIAEICPIFKEDFEKNFNDELSRIKYKSGYNDLSSAHQKTIRNHRTEIAGTLFGLYYSDEHYIYESESNKKLLEDNDQPAFFKNLCLNFQFPNGTQKIQTIVERIDDNIKFKPFHFLLSLISLAKKNNVILTKDEIAYYVLNAKQVLQGKISVEEVLTVILKDRKNNTSKKLKVTSFNTQHIREQLNLLALANLIFIDGDFVILNHAEANTINLFISELKEPLKFDIYKYDLSIKKETKAMYSDWSEYFGKVAVTDYELISTSIEALQGVKVEKPVIPNKGTDHTILGDEGEAYVFTLEKNRVNKTHPRLTNKVLLLGKQRGFGYDISSVEAAENIKEPEFARFIEVKSTKRVSEPDLQDTTWIDTISLTRKEWIAAKQYRTAYNIYRVYFTPNATIVRKINNPFDKNENGIITVLPTMYRMDFSSQSIDKQY